MEPDSRIGDLLDPDPGGKNGRKFVENALNEKEKKNVLQISVNKSNTVKTKKQILYFYLALHEFLIYFQATFYPP